MIIAVLADEQLKQEFLRKKCAAEVDVIWADSIRSLGIIEADAYFDLMFRNEPGRVARLQSLLAAPVFVNAVTHTTAQIGAPFIRINAWPTMLERESTEYSTDSPNDAEKANAILSKMGWKALWVPDTTGMVTPRIVAMIINEAWFAVAEKVSAKEQIDAAMKLGTSYPYGPFEWGEKIGMDRVKELLSALRRSDPRYTVAPGLAE